MKLAPPADLKFAAHLLGPAGIWSRDRVMYTARNSAYTNLPPDNPAFTLMENLARATGGMR